MSQYTGQKRQSALDSTDGFSSATQTGAAPNPHIPKFVSKVPWYLGETTDHHKSVKRDFLESSQVSSIKGSLGDVKVKFEAGACENCGAKSHKRKDCLERPRKVLAKYSNEKLASDDVNSLNDRSTFEGKRDRWKEYDASRFLNEVVASDKKPSASSALHLKEGETFAMATNMRVREDTAKYLLEIGGEEGAAHYDPKSRSLRVVGNTDGQFDKFSPEAEQVMKLRKRFAWDDQSSSASAAKVTEVTNPTQVAKEMREEEERQKRVVAERKRLLQAQYGPS